MSIMHCDVHGHWDSDLLDECPRCIYTDIQEADREMKQTPHALAQAFLVEKLQWDEPTWEAICTIHRSQLRELLTAFAALETERCAVIAETPMSGEQDDVTRAACNGIAKRIREAKS